MHRDAVMQKLKAPAMLIIGNVAASAAELQWFGRHALVVAAPSSPPCHESTSRGTVGSVTKTPQTRQGT